MLALTVTGKKLVKIETTVYDKNVRLRMSIVGNKTIKSFDCKKNTSSK